MWCLYGCSIIGDVLWLHHWPVLPCFMLAFEGYQTWVSRWLNSKCFFACLTGLHFVRPLRCAVTLQRLVCALIYFFIQPASLPAYLQVIDILNEKIGYSMICVTCYLMLFHSLLVLPTISCFSTLFRCKNSHQTLMVRQHFTCVPLHLATHCGTDHSTPLSMCFRNTWGQWRRWIDSASWAKFSMMSHWFGGNIWRELHSQGRHRSHAPSGAAAECESQFFRTILICFSGPYSWKNVI